jgi:hypothetical protein
MHDCGQAIGLPAGHPVAGSVSQSLPHVVVRQKARAELAVKTALASAMSQTEARRACTVTR